ncbi:hypothetical protein BB558_004291 [Smittium angustum]|uniref:INO80 complex subunit B-like conserved region domain-containing protein n=1 Tax=Smittium angustum TaxID=133377 RepID=A0A2U1J025_SMIAN|nr:hypothetical protein BB558_005615 [Smittium angustum]PVZ99649.1 hypothetical protein BB558_004291 [Smittium angustum]
MNTKNKAKSHHKILRIKLKTKSDIAKLSSESDENVKPSIKFEGKGGRRTSSVIMGDSDMSELSDTDLSEFESSPSVETRGRKNVRLSNGGNNKSKKSNNEMDLGENNEISDEYINDTGKRKVGGNGRSKGITKKNIKSGTKPKSKGKKNIGNLEDSESTKPFKKTQPNVLPKTTKGKTRNSQIVKSEYPEPTNQKNIIEPLQDVDFSNPLVKTLSNTNSNEEGSEIFDFENLDYDSNEMFSGEDGELDTVLSQKMTRRQRARLTNNYEEELMELPTDSKKQEFTKEELALRRSEYSRRRKFQSMQRAEQLKNETISRLLNKQSSKGRNKLIDDDSKSQVDSLNEMSTAIRWRSFSTANNKTNEISRIATLGNPTNRNSDKSTNQTNNTNDEKNSIGFSLSFPSSVSIDDMFPGSANKPTTNIKKQNEIVCSFKGCKSAKKYKFFKKTGNNQELLYACGLSHYKGLIEGQ